MNQTLKALSEIVKQHALEEKLLVVPSCHLRPRTSATAAWTSDLYDRALRARSPACLIEEEVRKRHKKERQPAALRRGNNPRSMDIEISVDATEFSR